MRIPKRLEPLMEEGLVDEVIRPITSGKEAEVYIVRSLGVLRAAKVYKESHKRSFKHRADYMEGRLTRNSRDARAKGSKFAREQEEDAWQSSEVTALGRLRAAGVRVPEPRGFMDGVLLMDLVLTLEGEPAPRLADCSFTREEARTCFETLLNEVKLILCEGLVHGDLSEYNVLLSAYGPVIIDLPQMVSAAANSQARGLFLRDVANLKHFFGRMAPELMRSRHGEELWNLWESGQLSPETALSPLPEPRVEGERRGRRHYERHSLTLGQESSAPALGESLKLIDAPFTTESIEAESSAAARSAPQRRDYMPPPREAQRRSPNERPYHQRDQGHYERPYQQRDQGHYDRPYQPRDQGHYERPYQQRDQGHYERPYQQRDQGHYERPYQQRDQGHYERPYQQRDQGHYDRPPRDQGHYERPHHNQGYQQRPYQQRDQGHYERPPRNQGHYDRPQHNQGYPPRPYQQRDQGHYDRPYQQRDQGHYERPHHDQDVHTRSAPPYAERQHPPRPRRRD